MKQDYNIALSETYNNEKCIVEYFIALLNTCIVKLKFLQNFLKNYVYLMINENCINEDCTNEECIVENCITENCIA